MDTALDNAIAQAEALLHADPPPAEAPSPAIAGTSPPPPAPAQASASAPEENGSWFPKPPDVPTQADSSGIRFDSNDGCRVVAPVGPDVWRIRLFDLDAGNILFQTTPDLRGGGVLSAKKYFVRFRFEAWEGRKAHLLS